MRCNQYQPRHQIASEASLRDAVGQTPDPGASAPHCSLEPLQGWIYSNITRVLRQYLMRGAQPGAGKSNDDHGVQTGEGKRAGVVCFPLTRSLPARFRQTLFSKPLKGQVSTISLFQSDQADFIGSQLDFKLWVS